MTWLLIDGNNWYARDFFASSDSAAGNFLRRLADLRSQVDHSRVAIAWDARTSFRHAISDSYKADRAEKPDGFHLQLSELRNELAAREGLTSFYRDGFEADDLLAALARNAIDEGEKAVIFSSDADLHQCLVKGSVSQVISLRRATARRLSFVTMTADSLVDKYGIKPWQWVDFQIMVGGQDSLKGCEGIGQKSAAAVLAKCGSLDGFYATPFKAPVTDKQRNKLLEFRPRVEQLRKLCTLVDSAPLPANWLQVVAL